MASSPAINPLDAVLFKGMNSSISLILKAEIVGILAQAIVLGVTLVQLSNYFRLYNEIDPLYLRVAMALGTIVTTCQLIMTTHCTLSLAEHTLDYSSHLESDLHYTSVVDLLVCLMRCTTLPYFCRRPWALTGKSVTGGILLASLIGICTGFGITTTVYGFRVPPLRTFADLPKLIEWNKQITKWVKVWAISSLGVDFVICTGTIYVLWRTSWEMNIWENTLFRRVIIVITEAMIPQISVVFTCLMIFHFRGVMSTYDRSLIWINGPLLYYAVLHSLLSRQRLANTRQTHPTEFSGSNQKSQTSSGPSIHSTKNESASKAIQLGDSQDFEGSAEDQNLEDVSRTNGQSLRGLLQSARNPLRTRGSGGDNLPLDTYVAPLGTYNGRKV